MLDMSRLVVKEAAECHNLTHRHIETYLVSYETVVNRTEEEYLCFKIKAPSGRQRECSVQAPKM